MVESGGGGGGEEGREGGRRGLKMRLIHFNFL